MADTNTAVQGDQLIFSAELTPYRSLGRTGFIVLMTIVGIFWLGAGVLFWMKGAWPIFGFFGLDLILLYVAFKLNYRAARVREHVTVRRSDLHIRQIAPSGKTREHRFNPFWTRFHVSRHSEIGITGMNVVGHGRSVSIGLFLNPKDRESFSAAFAGALAAAKKR